MALLRACPRPGLLASYRLNDLAVAVLSLWRLQGSALLRFLGSEALTTEPRSLRVPLEGFVTSASGVSHNPLFGAKLPTPNCKP